MDTNNYSYHNIRSSAILTGSYVAGTVLGPTNGNPSRFNQLEILANFTIGSLTTAELIVEFSHDGTTYYQETVSTVSGSTSVDTELTHQFNTTGQYRIQVPISDNYIKISVKGTGTVTSSLMTVDAILANV
jgi:hypothetical protein